MGAFKHTPGPWRWEHGALRADNEDFVMWPQNVMGGDAPNTWADQLGACGAHSEDAAEANARLIAAAPELLTAVQRALSYLSSTEGEFGIELESAAMCRAALAKAGAS